MMLKFFRAIKTDFSRIILNSKNTFQILVIWFVMGMMYYTIEGFWRVFTHTGKASISMLIVGGIAGGLVGCINQIPGFYNKKVLYQALMGMIVATIIEFISGYILNIKFGLDIWDYSDFRFNIMGQICLKFSFYWFLLIPFAIWVEDSLRYILYGEGERYSLFSIYKELFTFK